MNTTVNETDQTPCPSGADVPEPQPGAVCAPEDTWQHPETVLIFITLGGQGATGTQRVESRDVPKVFKAQDGPKQRVIHPRSQQRQGGEALF